MDGAQFDRIVLHVASTAPRRLVISGIAGLLMTRVLHREGDARKKARKKCKKGKKRCGKQCFDLLTNAANCGACGVACPSGKVCRDGVCACPADQSFIAGACIPRFGCTLELDSCTFGKKACPVTTNLGDARCYVSAAGEPFCATSLDCGTEPAGDACPTIGGLERVLIPCAVCNDPGETGGCVLPIAKPRSDV